MVPSQKLTRCCRIWSAEFGLRHPSDWRGIEPTEDHSRGRFRVYVRLAAFTVRGWPTATEGLDGDLARLQQCLRR